MLYYLLLNRDVLSVSNFEQREIICIIMVFFGALKDGVRCKNLLVVMRDYKDSVNVPKIHTRYIVCLHKISHG